MEIVSYLFMDLRDLKIGDLVLILAKSFADHGNFVITFNFSHNGVGENIN